MADYRPQPKLVVPDSDVRVFENVPLRSLPWQDEIIAAAPDTAAEDAIWGAGHVIGALLGRWTANIVLARFSRKSRSATSFSLSECGTSLEKAQMYAEQYGLTLIVSPRLCLAVTAYLRTEMLPLFQLLCGSSATLVSPTPVTASSQSRTARRNGRGYFCRYVCVQSDAGRIAATLLSADDLERLPGNVWYVFVE